MLQDEVLETARQYLTRVKRSGSDHITAICPFHLSLRTGGAEESPSFTMSLSKGLFFCFTCHEKGTLRTFLRKVGLPRSVVDKRFGKLIDDVASNRPRERNLARQPPISKNPLPESVLGLFDYCPLGLLEEGFKEDLLQEYDIGFDEKHMRMTFPLRDMKGQLVGISGRSVVDDFPKYKLYDKEYTTWGFPPYHTEKREVLWNFDRVYPNVFFRTDKPSVYVVEGFKACLWMIQNGYKDTVALLGVHLSEEHLMLLESLGATVVLMLDNNVWGRRGTARVGKRIRHTLDVKVAEYDESKPQPSDLTPDEIRSAVDGAKDYSLWVTEERNKRWLLERTPQT